METWRIAMPIVILLVCVMIAMYITMLLLQEIKSKTYVHPETGCKYIPLSRCRMKNPVSGEWFDALIYQEVNNGELYVRECKDFFDRFVKLSDWKNETKETKESGQC